MHPRTYVQIGTNDGNDLFQKKVRLDKPDVVILVEPNSSCEGKIRRNYENVPNVFVYINALYYHDAATVDLFIPAKNKVLGNKGENNHVYSDHHFSLLPMNDWGSKDNMIRIQVPTISFPTLCKNHSITHIDYLQIDTEGFDSEIIQMIDFGVYNIATIRFEKWYFSSDKFTRYQQDKATTLGESGMKVAIRKLEDSGYTIKEIQDEDGNDLIATR